MAVPVSATQEINPGAIVELFTLTLDSTLHGASTVYRFHNGANLNTNCKFVWNGNEYDKNGNITGKWENGNKLRN